MSSVRLFQNLRQAEITMIVEVDKNCYFNRLKGACRVIYSYKNLILDREAKIYGDYKKSTGR